MHDKYGIKIKNIFKSIPKEIKEELFEELIRSDNCKIERIISKCHATEAGKWYEQEKNEFVLLLKGSAELLFFPDKIINMKPGDYINIPCCVKHRVEKTDAKKETIWLAVFY